MTKTAPNENDIYNIVIECSSLFDSLTEPRIPSEIDPKTEEASSTSTSHHDPQDDRPTGDLKTASGSQIKHGGEGKEKRRIKIEQMGRSFDLWINYTGALAAVGRSLDDRLRGHTDIKEMVVELLQMLARNLQYICDGDTLNFKPPQDATSLRDQNLEEEAWTATEQAIDDLHFMAAAIRRSSVQSQKYNLLSRFERDDDLYFEERATLFVKREFPNARRSLCEQLGASIAVRRKRLFRRKLHEEKLSMRREMVPVSSRPLKRAAGPVSKPHVSPSQASARPTPLPFQRLKKEKNLPMGSDDTKSKLESVAARNYIKGGPSLSTISTGSSIRNSTIDYPAIPKYLGGDKHCACPYCAKPLEVERLRKDPEYWEAHIDEDVKPYVCLSEECTSPVVFFVHMREWLDHMNVMHSDQWTRKIHMTTWYCDVEHDGEVLQFNDYDRFVEHMKDPTNHPKRQPPTDLQLDTLSKNKQKLLVREEEYSCPLCDCVPDSIEPVIRTGNPKDVKYLLDKHIAKHVKILAFISVPVLASADPDQKEASVADADDKDRRRLRKEGSAASYPSGFDPDIRAISLSFIEDPPRTDLEIIADDFYEFPDTCETYLDDIGFNDYKMAEGLVSEEEMHRQALDLTEKILGKEHFRTLDCMNNLAEVLRNQGKYEEAEQIHRQILELRETVLGKEPPKASGTFSYPPLSLEEGEEEIRLLRLRSLGDDSKQIPSDWSLETFLSSHRPLYNALSYTWADPSTDLSTSITRRTEEVKVNSKHLKITTNLAEFLRHLENDALERWAYFWIDAICIDQENVKERNLFVQRMNQIYERASQVIIWLGSDRFNVAKVLPRGLAKVQENLGDNAISEISQAEWSLIEQNTGSAVTGRPLEEDGFAIFENPWWTRAWIIQEASTPTKDDTRIVHLHGLALKRVSTAHVVWIGKQRFTFDQLVEMAWFLHEENRGNSGVKSALELHMVQRGRQRQGRQRRTRRLDLYDLLPMVRRYDCADPRDKIYSVLAIADDYRPGDLRPDYSKPVTQIYTGLVRYLIERDRCLDILGFCSAQRNLTDLPSWVPDWTYKDVPASLLSLERQHRRRTRFNACGRMGYFVQFRNWDSSIRCYGLEFDKVTNIGPLRSQDYESFYNQLSSDEKKKMDELSNPVWSEYHRRDQRPRYRTSRPDPASLPDPDMVAEAHLIREATMLRRLIWTQRGYVGLAPAGVQIDCIICVLAGCRVPLVLQRVSNDYKLIGECYILGIMGGEVERGSNVERDAVEYNIW